MKPYYEHDGITIYHGDCLEILPILPKVDLVLTDPPYGIGLENHDKDVESSRPMGWKIHGDNDSRFVIWFMEINSHFPTIAFASPKKPWPGEWKQYLVWDKGPAVGGGGDPSSCWKMDWELIQTRNLGKLEGKRDSSVLRFWVTPSDSPLHPAQKPLKLICYLMSKVSAETVLDPFMGSGTTLRAAKDLGRKAIGIEIEERYCEIAAKRMSQEVLCLSA